MKTAARSARDPGDPPPPAAGGVRAPSSPAAREWGGALATLAALTALTACSSKSAGPPELPPPPVACQDFSFPIYFEGGSETLTASARSEIRYAAARVRGCFVQGVTVVGLADAQGPAGRNLVLSQARARIASAELAAAGLPAPSFTVKAFGASGARTPDGDAEPLRRRTEVVIRATPPARPETSRPQKAPDAREPGA